MSVEIVKTSRLNFYDLMSEDGYEFWQNRTLPVPTKTKDDQKKQINGEDRIDNVAYTSYEDTVLWWIIAIAPVSKIIPSGPVT